MDNIGYLLMKVSKDLKYTLSTKLLQYDLTTAQWSVLKCLDLEEKQHTTLIRRTAVELAAKLDFDKPTISGILKRLADKGMIVKESHPHDRRASVIVLTEKARGLIPILEQISDSIIEESLQSFDQEEKELFIMYLKKMDASLS
ncbi:MarR family transcriptional regulator [Bacillus sp. T3]|uniref:MarR family winged helix-turn-helix transcriptional regulator n=1 Tax=Bacillus sp. T3 TaxID=467262 RepID=UPI002980D688|nr:MarR family transcriptional regulator [Bacillus sp. T3]